ncbi:MAG TPA: hypothetical protein VF531_05625 [Bacillota bacterium]
MDRTKKIQHQGKDIVSVDFSNLGRQSLPEIMNVIDGAATLIRCNPPQSVLVITICTGMMFDIEIMKLIGEYVAGNKPYIKASALVGADGLLRSALSNAKRVSGRNDLNLFQSTEEALNWLATQ